MDVAHALSRSMPSAIVPGHDVNGALNFITSKINRRYIAPGNELNAGTYETHVVPIGDARPTASDFELNKQGFVLNEHNSKVSLVCADLTLGDRLYRCRGTQPRVLSRNRAVHQESHRRWQGSCFNCIVRSDTPIRNANQDSLRRPTSTTIWQIQKQWDEQMYY